MLRTGIDMIEIERLRCTLERYGERFLERVFTPQERFDARDRVDSLAVRFAAKEAVAKALGCGIGVVTWQEIEILRGPAREPVLQLHGVAAERAATLGLSAWSVSLSHTRNYATAIAVAISEPE